MADEQGLRAVYPSLRGKRVLVTGGGSGIGAGIVEGFARQGADVTFFDVTDGDSRALAERVGARYVENDLLDVSATQQAIAKLEAAGGAFDVLVNNAANDDRHSIEDVTEEYWDNRLDEAVMDALCYDDPRRSRAALSGAEECAVDRAGDRALEVRIVEYDQRILAAHLQLYSRLPLDRALRDQRADALGSREGYRIDVGMIDDRAADTAVADDEIEHARWRTCFVDDRGERMGDCRCRSRRLHDDRVAEGERGRRLPRRNRDREIPRSYEPNDAQRFAVS